MTSAAHALNSYASTTQTLRNVFLIGLVVVAVIIIVVVSKKRNQEEEK